MAAYRKGDDIIGLEGIGPSVDERYVTYYNTFCIENNVLTYKLYSTYASKFHERTYHLTPSEIVQLKTSPATGRLAKGRLVAGIAGPQQVEKSDSNTL